jgi:DNA-binding transcriptional LysR family regulator
VERDERVQAHSEVLLQQLEYLVALARERHFGRAARTCHVSQPTLSVAIQRLEKHLGVVIVLRGKRFEGFTEEGSRVIAWAHRIIAERDELLADVERMRGRLTATARVGAIPTSVPASPLLTQQFRRHNPGATIRIEATSSREIARQLADFELDAGITYLDDETPPNTRRLELYRENYVLLAPADHPLMEQSTVSWHDVAGLDLCALTPAMRNRRILAANIAAAGARFDPVVEADTVGALFAHLAGRELATIASHAWLYAFGVPHGLAARPMAQSAPGPAVGLTVLDRKPNSIMADAIIEAAATADYGTVLQQARDRWLSPARGPSPGAPRARRR